MSISRLVHTHSETGLFTMIGHIEVRSYRLELKLKTKVRFMVRANFWVNFRLKDWVKVRATEDKEVG